MSFLEACKETAIGIDSIRCLNEVASYSLGWVLIIMAVVVMWNQLGFSSVKDKVAAISFWSSILSMLMIAVGFLPETAFVYFFFAALGGVVALMFRG